MWGNKKEEQPVPAYRVSVKPEEPLTDHELALWDAVYAAVVAGYDGPRAAEYADKAVDRRRMRFGVR